MLFANNSGSTGEARRGSDEEIAERAPQGKNAIVRRQMPAQRAVACFGIAIEANMSHQEVIERSKRRFIPIRGAKDRAEDLLKSAILIGWQAPDPRHRVNSSDLRKIC